MRKEINPSEALNIISAIVAETFVCIGEITPDTWIKTTRTIWTTDELVVRIVGFNLSTGKQINEEVVIHGVTELVDLEKPSQSRYKRLRDLYFSIESALVNSIENKFTMEYITGERCKTMENLESLWSKLRQASITCRSMDEFMEHADRVVDMFNKMSAVPDFVVDTLRYVAYTEKGHGTEINIEKETDNPSKNKVFDFITVSIPVALTYVDVEERRKLFKTYSKLLDHFAVRKIKNSKEFKKYGVPVNILKCTNKVYTRDSRLVYTFELKEIGE